MLQRDSQNQRLYLHDAVSGTEKELFDLNGDHLDTTESTDENGKSFTTNILIEALNFKKNNSTITDNSLLIHFC